VETRKFASQAVRLAIAVACIALPLAMTAYVHYFIDPTLLFKSYLAHEIVVAFAVAWGLFICYIA
jgi:hypothetical protein